MTPSSAAKQAADTEIRNYLTSPPVPGPGEIVQKLIDEATAESRARIDKLAVDSARLDAIRQELHNEGLPADDVEAIRCLKTKLRLANEYADMLERVSRQDQGAGAALKPLADLADNFNPKHPPFEHSALLHQLLTFDIHRAKAALRGEDGKGTNENRG